MSAILEVEGIRVTFTTAESAITAVAGVDLRLAAGEMLAIVGESGCGKTTLALAFLGLLPLPAAHLTFQKALFMGKRLPLDMPSKLQPLRGKRIAMIFQEPLSALNPVITIGEQMVEVLRMHLGLEKREAISRAIALLEMVGIPRPNAVFAGYPHQLSGGMRQRVMIATAFSCYPELVIADEPTTALDVTVQAQILRLLRDLRRKNGVGFLFITHDLAIVAQEADRLAIMYAGKIVETGKSRDVFSHPLHPYTNGLMASLPPLDGAPPRRLRAIPGAVPRGDDDSQRGCDFAPRCARAAAVCWEAVPTLMDMDAGHACACWRCENG